MPVRFLCRCLVLSLLLTAIAACARSGAAPAGEDRGNDAIPAVEVVEARDGAVPLRERLTGTVRASGEVAIFPEVSGSVVEVLVENGDAVTKGQPLVRLQTTGTRADLSQARSSLEAVRAQLSQAEARHRELAAEYERNRALGERGLVAENLVESLRAQTEAARAAAASARAQVEAAQAAVARQTEVHAQTVVRAPISGRVGSRNAEVGMVVGAQAPLFVIGRLDTVRVEVPVTQDVLTRVREGQRVELRTASGAAPIEARVSRLSPFLQPGSFSAEVEVDVSNETGALIPGMFVTVDIFYGESGRTTLVPASAIYEDPRTGATGVFVTSTPPPPLPADLSGGARPAAVALPFRPVEIVAEAAQVSGVTGVRPGEWVVVVGQHLLAAQTGGTPRATVREIAWDRILELQQLQREDLLEQFMQRQQRSGREG